MFTCWSAKNRERSCFSENVNVNKLIHDVTLSEEFKKKELETFEKYISDKAGGEEPAGKEGSWRQRSHSWKILKDKCANHIWLGGGISDFWYRYFYVLLIHEKTAQVIVQDAIKRWFYIRLSIVETPFKNAAFNDGAYINADQVGIGTGSDKAAF